MDDIDVRESGYLEQKLQYLADEERHYETIKRVFDGEDGLYVLTWLLGESGFWESAFSSERAIGKFEFGRMIFNTVCISDMQIATKLIADRRRLAEENRIKEKQAVLDKIKQHR